MLCFEYPCPGISVQLCTHIITQICPTRNIFLSLGRRRNMGKTAKQFQHPKTHLVSQWHRRSNIRRLSSPSSIISLVVNNMIYMGAKFYFHATKQNLNKQKQQLQQLPLDSVRNGNEEKKELQNQLVWVVVALRRIKI